MVNRGFQCLARNAATQEIAKMPLFSFFLRESPACSGRFQNIDSLKPSGS
jgi:hypothetical protein